jgi:hypothetical protein
MIDINQLPKYVIDLSQLNDAADIKFIMRQHKVTDYCYAFTSSSSVMKYGQSADSDPGERIYRQARFIQGWPTIAAPRSAGHEFETVLEHFPGIRKNNICIKVWDMTNYPFLADDHHDFELTKLENQLITEHINLFGYRPIGNKRTEDHIVNKSIVPDAVYNNLFEE